MVGTWTLVCGLVIAFSWTDLKSLQEIYRATGIAVMPVVTTWVFSFGDFCRQHVAALLMGWAGGLLLTLRGTYDRIAVKAVIVLALFCIAFPVAAWKVAHRPYMSLFQGIQSK